MRILFLGTGDAFCTSENNFHANFLIESADAKRLLVDCGGDVRHALHAVDLSYRDITDVYISHLHADHADGLEWLGYSHYFDTNSSKPNLYISDTLVNDLWHKLSPSMRSLENKTALLQDYFNIHAIKESDPNFNCHGILYSLIKTRHVYDNHRLVPTYGLLITTDSQKIVFTADTQFCPDIFMSYYQKADLILQECETRATPSGVHTHYNQLMTLDKNIRAKMWLYHYQEDPSQDAKKDGFLGFAKRGQLLTLS